MRYLLLIALMLAVHCDTVAGSDPQSWLEPSHIKGVWLRIKEKPSQIPGLYQKDTTTYRIGMDSLPDTGPYYIKDPLTFYVVYEKGSTYGYIHSPDEDFSLDDECATLTYTLILGLPGPTTTQNVTFGMPVADSLKVTLGADEFGLQRSR